MDTRIFDKTDKGREEIVTRKYHLASRLRTLLVLMDGRHTTQDLLQKVAGLGLGPHSVAELLENGYVHLVASASADTPLESTEAALENAGSKEPAPSESPIQTKAAHYHFIG